MFASVGRLVNQPFQDSIEIGLLLGTDSIAADFAMGNGLHVQCLDDVVHGKLVRQIGLITQDEQRNSIEDWLFQQRMELLLCDRNGSLVRSIHDVSMQNSRIVPVYHAGIALTQWRSRRGNIAPTLIETLAGLQGPNYGNVRCMDRRFVRSGQHTISG